METQGRENRRRLHCCQHGSYCLPLHYLSSALGQQFPRHRTSSKGDGEEGGGEKSQSTFNLERNFLGPEDGGRRKRERKKNSKVDRRVRPSKNLLLHSFRYSPLLPFPLPPNISAMSLKWADVSPAHPKKKEKHHSKIKTCLLSCLQNRHVLRTERIFTF